MSNYKAFIAVFVLVFAALLCAAFDFVWLLYRAAVYFVR